MSKCISAKGEFSEHELDAKFTCVDCFAFDEDAALERIESLQAELAEARLVIARVQEYLMTCRVLRTEPDKNKIAAFLDAAPSSALDTVKHDAWDEGYTASESYDGYYASPENPYRRES